MSNTNYTLNWEQLELEKDRLEKTLIEVFLELNSNDSNIHPISPFIDKKHIEQCNKKIEEAKNIFKLLTLYSGREVETKKIIISYNFSLIGGKPHLDGKQVETNTISAFTGAFDFFGVPIFSGDMIGQLTFDSFLLEGNEKDFERAPDFLNPYIAEYRRNKNFHDAEELEEREVMFAANHSFNIVDKQIGLICKYLIPYEREDVLQRNLSEVFVMKRNGD